MAELFSKQQMHSSISIVSETCLSFALRYLEQNPDVALFTFFISVCCLVLSRIAHSGF